MALYTRKELVERAAYAGLHVSTWSPGDGMTRYRFSKDDRPFDAARPLYTALGLTEACTFLAGWLSHFLETPPDSLAWLEDAIGDADEDAAGLALLHHIDWRLNR